MRHNEIKKYLLKHRSKYSKKMLVAQLKKSGFKDSEIKNAYCSIDGPVSSRLEEGGSPMFPIIIILGILVSVIFFGYNSTKNLVNDFEISQPDSFELSNGFRAEVLKSKMLSNGDLTFGVQYIATRAAQVEVNSKNFILTSNTMTCTLNSISNAGGELVSVSSENPIVSFVNGQEAVLNYTCTSLGGTPFTTSQKVEGSLEISYFDPRTVALQLKSRGNFRLSIE